jgi:hypothetical protein
MEVRRWAPFPSFIRRVTPWVLVARACVRACVCARAGVRCACARKSVSRSAGGEVPTKRKRTLARRGALSRVLVEVETIEQVLVVFRPLRSVER